MLTDLDDKVRLFEIPSELRSSDVTLHIECRLVNFHKLRGDLRELHHGLVEFYDYVLPNMGKPFLRKLLRNAHLNSVVLLMSESDAIAMRRVKAMEQEEAALENSAEVSPASAEDHEVENDDEEEDEDGDDDDYESLVGENLGPDEPVSVKERIIAAATWEYVKNPWQRKLLQVTLIGVRLRYQTLRLGSKLLQAILKPELVGPL
eukprot:EC724456.1.p1 GENE.EC724456.1~~EC724456.1.p1  ORF type:complete len:205 (+),score=32.63 EC724456.1:8-622(+)